MNKKKGVRSPKKNQLSQPESTIPRAREASQNCASRNAFSILPPCALTHRTILFSLIILWTIIVYLNTLTNGFVFDDETTVTNNILIRSLTNIGFLFSEGYFTLSSEESYRPFVTFTYMIDYFLWELNPAGYHLTNLILHILSVFSLYLLIVNLWKDSTFALIASAVFALTPVNTEAVNAISFREDLLITPLCLFSLITHRNLQIPNLPETKRRIIKLASSMLYLLALFSKEMAIVLPLIAMVIDYHREKKLILKNYLGYFIIFVLYLGFRVFLFSNPDSTTPEDAGIVIPDFISRITWVPFIISFYLHRFFFPVNLAADYGGTIYLNPWNVVILIILIGLFVKSKSDKIKISIVWFLISLIPVLNIIPIRHPIAERYLYFPAVAASILLSALIHQIKSKQVSIYICLLLVFSLLIFERNKIWNNGYTLWSDTIEKFPGSFGGHYNLGIQYENKGLLDQATDEFKIALELNPNSAEAHFSLGNVYLKQNNIDAAIGEYKTALNLNPDFIEGHFNLGIALLSKGLKDMAKKEFEIVLKLKPGHVQARNAISMLRPPL